MTKVYATHANGAVVYAHSASNELIRFQRVCVFGDFAGIAWPELREYTGRNFAGTLCCSFSDRLSHSREGYSHESLLSYFEIRVDAVLKV